MINLNKKKNSVLISKKPLIFFKSKNKKKCFLIKKKIKISKKVFILKNKVYQISLSSISNQVLLNYSAILKQRLKKLRFFTVFFKVPLKKKYMTLLKSPHVHKKAKESFESIRYKIGVLINPKVNIIKLRNLFIRKPNSVSFKIVFNDIKKKQKNPFRCQIAFYFFKFFSSFLYCAGNEDTLNIFVSDIIFGIWLSGFAAYSLYSYYGTNKIAALESNLALDKNNGDFNFIKYMLKSVEDCIMSQKFLLLAILNWKKFEDLLKSFFTN